MRIARLVMLQFLVVGMLTLASLAQAGTAEHAGTGVPTFLLDTDAALCCEDPSPLARTTCEMPCLCLQALPGAVAELHVSKAAGFPAPAARRLADRTHYPDPLPPKSPAT